MNHPAIPECRIKVKQIYETFDASHDWQHIERVMQNAWHIAQTEGGDPLLIELAVLLHDVSDPKYKKDGEDWEQEILQQLELTAEQRGKIRSIITTVSFKGGTNDEPDSIEGKIVRDADRLDAIGAIGIARAFAYGGAKGRKFYDPAERARTAMTESEYRTGGTSTVTHFYEKLLLLKELMVTDSGKQMAEERHQFMLSFLEQLQNETDGKK
ncbi:HD domain-containing protein [Planococcus sp. ISL-109]|uniref:HD domain-containing protein n=1 Tax=Planococcus sp. ISL-109 TaxID=2819166 RepID=UPI001BEC72DC|nr:HD domain-containing protein [Planococcus sp. ISL-109]MBT2582102.1 HD domain-containing protein [Planococcus sp. ISL-109]